MMKTNVIASNVIRVSLVKQKMQRCDQLMYCKKKCNPNQVSPAEKSSKVTTVYQ
jgi:hypothetical protein